MASVLVVEHRELTIAPVEASRLHPDLVLDFFVEVATREKLHAILQVHAGTRASREEMKKVVSATFPRVSFLPPPDSSSWIAAFEVPSGALEAGSRAMIGFAQENGIDTLWGRIEQGVAFSRLLVPPGRDVAGLAGMLERAMAKEDVVIAVEEDSDGRLAKRLAGLRQFLHPGL